MSLYIYRKNSPNSIQNNLILKKANDLNRHYYKEYIKMENWYTNRYSTSIAIRKNAI